MRGCPTVRASYTKDQVILYHLGLGAGVPATDPKELEYTYEKNLKVLPSFAVVPAIRLDGRASRASPACSSTSRCSCTASRR